jgi:hypothetical protein
MTANNPRTRKAKGRMFQNEIVETLGKKYIHLTLGKDKDIQGREMGQTGTDIRLSDTAKLFIPFDIECKAVEQLNIWKALAQAESNTSEGRIPLLVFRRARSKTYAVIELDKLLWVMQ